MSIDREHLAKEAERLLRDEVLREAVGRVRGAAVDALIRADATQAHEVVRLQAKIAVCDEFLDELRDMVLQQSMATRPRLIT